MNLDEMRKLKKEIEEKRKLNEPDKKEGDREFRNLINASREKQTALKRQISKGIKRKESYFSRIDLGHLSFLVIVLISITSVLVFIPFEIKKVFQDKADDVVRGFLASLRTDTMSGGPPLGSSLVVAVKE